MTNSGGDIDIKAGDGGQGGEGGNIEIKGGDASDAGKGGDVVIKAGDGGTETQKKSWFKREGIIPAIIGALAVIIAATIPLFCNKSKDNIQDTKNIQQTNEIKNNYSPISGNVENQTINYFQTDTPIQKPTEKLEKQEHQTKPKNESKTSSEDANKSINVTSYNQSGGITANQVNVNTKETQRALSESDKNRTIQKINELIIANNKDNQVCIKIDADQGAEEYKLAKEIYDFLIKEGFNVQDGIAVTMARLPPLEGVRMIFSKGCIEISVGYKKMFPVSTKK